MIKHLWFDFAGTLYRETQEFNELHDQFRFTTYAKLQGLDDLVIARNEYMKLYDEHGSNSAVFRSLGQPSNFWMQALDDMDFASVLKRDEQVNKTLEQLAERLPLSLFTNFKHEKIQELLTHLELKTSIFTFILSGDDVAERKPALNGFREMINLSALSPDQIMYVGDRIDVDIKPAKQLGMRTAFVYGENDLADYSIMDLKDLLNIDELKS